MNKKRIFMAGHWTGLFSYITGVVRFHDLAYLAKVGDELNQMKVVHSYVTEWDRGTWRLNDETRTKLDWGIVSATVVKKPIEQGLFLGVGGQVLCMGSGDTHKEQISGVDGTMRGLGTIDGIAYTCGMNRQVYQRRDREDWVAVDKGTRVGSGSKVVSGFEAIAGFNKNEIFAVGWNGEIWRYDEKQWQRQKSPTDLILTSVLCSDDGSVYVCGQSGMLIQGDGSEWKILEQKTVSENLWSLAWFKDELYASGMRGVYKLKDGQLTEVDFGDEDPQTLYHLSAADGVLWSIGPKDVLAFDGNKWTRID